MAERNRVGAYTLSGPAGPFTMADVMRLTLASRSQLVYWTSCGLIVANVRETSGTGHPRLFDLENLVEIAVAVCLSGYKLPVRSLRWVIHVVRSMLASGVEMMLVTNDPFRGDPGVKVYSGAIGQMLTPPEWGDGGSEDREFTFSAPVAVLVNVESIFHTVLGRSCVRIIDADTERLSVGVTCHVSPGEWKTPREGEG